jgi:hypothetical protein
MCQFTHARVRCGCWIAKSRGFERIVVGTFTSAQELFFASSRACATICVAALPKEWAGGRKARSRQPGVGGTAYSVRSKEHRGTGMFDVGSWMSPANRTWRSRSRCASRCSLLDPRPSQLEEQYFKTSGLGRWRTRRLSRFRVDRGESIGAISRGAPMLRSKSHCFALVARRAGLETRG